MRKLCILLLLLAPLPALARPPEFPAPDGARVSSVAENMTVQGRNMAVRSFLTDDTVEQVVEFYKALWAEPPTPKAPGYAYEPEVLAPWHLVTRVEDGYVLTVQVQKRDPAGAFGYLALGRLPDPGDGPVQLPKPPMMDGSQVLSNVLTDDPGKKAQTSMVANEFSLASNLNYYRNLYADWRKDIDQAMGHDSMHALSFRKGREQVIITIKSGRDGSHIVLNSIKHDLL